MAGLLGKAFANQASVCIQAKAEIPACLSLENGKWVPDNDQKLRTWGKKLAFQEQERSSLKRQERSS